MEVLKQNQNAPVPVRETGCDPLCGYKGCSGISKVEDVNDMNQDYIPIWMQMQQA